MAFSPVSLADQAARAMGAHVPEPRTPHRHFLLRRPTCNARGRRASQAPDAGWQDLAEAVIEQALRDTSSPSRHLRTDAYRAIASGGLEPWIYAATVSEPGAGERLNAALGLWAQEHAALGV